jgi:hypothetical protein
MKRAVVALMAMLLAAPAYASSGFVIIEIMRRGDANGNGLVDVADSSFIGNYLFSGGSAPPCMDQADVNDDGSLDMSDCIYLNNYLFNGGPEPPAPGPNNGACARDWTSPNLSCNSGPCA